MPHSYIEEKDGETWISLRVQPKSSQNKVEAKEDGSISVWVTAPPEKDKANAMVVQLLAKQLGVAKRDIRIISGAKSRRKTFAIAQRSAADVARHLYK